MSDRSKSVLLRLTPSEHAQLTANANAAGQSVNTYLRAKALGITPQTPDAYQALAAKVETLTNVAEEMGWSAAIKRAQSKLGKEE